MFKDICLFKDIQAFNVSISLLQVLQIYRIYRQSLTHTEALEKKRHAAAHVSNSLIELTSSLELRAVTQPVPSLWSAALPLQRVKRKSLTGLMLLPHTVCTTTSSSSSSCISNYQILVIKKHLERRHEKPFGEGLTLSNETLASDWTNHLSIISYSGITLTNQITSRRALNQTLIRASREKSGTSFSSRIIYI